MKLTGEDKAYLRKLMKDYLKEIPDATPEEKAELKEWVTTGHSPYDNPYSVWGEDGFPLDYISAIRFWEDFDPLEGDDENPVPVEEGSDPFWDGVDPFAEEPPKQE